MELPRYNPGLHRLALLTAAATFPLIFIGGLVTSHDAGMAVPDWPNSYGYNMFLFPPSRWVGNIWYEHVHRLYASGLGLLSITLCVWAFLTDRRPAVRRLAAAVLGGVIVQGVLGGLRVVLARLGLAIVHGCFAQAFFCLTALLALVTSPRWIDSPDLTRAKDAEAGRRLGRWAMIAVTLVYAQLIIGAVMRHDHAGLAIQDFPLAFGHVLPPTSERELVESLPAAGTAAPAATRVARPGSLYSKWLALWPAGGPFRADPDTINPHTLLVKVWLQYAHRIGAIVVSGVLLSLVYRVFRLHRGRPNLAPTAVVLVMLLVTQLVLGGLTVLLQKPADIASAHVAVGALALMTTFVLAAKTLRMYSARLRTQPGTAGRPFQVVMPTLDDGRSPAFNAVRA